MSEADPRLSFIEKKNKDLESDRSKCASGIYHYQLYDFTDFLNFPEFAVSSLDWNDSSYFKELLQKWNNMTCRKYYYCCWYIIDNCCCSVARSSPTL